jgi:alkylation response protein AidB-like acyl-CoA dehydrogenase
MDFAWSPQQREIFDAIEKFAAAELNTDLIDRDRASLFNHDGWKQCGKMGIQGLAVPTEHGGLGQDPLTTVGALERFGYGCRDNGLVFSINAHMWTACAPLVAFGSDQQKARFLPGLCNGDLIGGNAMSEPGSGSDAYSMRTTAVKQGDRYVLNGSKIFVTNGPVADVIVVFASTDRAKGAAGIGAFLVEKSFKGLSIARKLEKMGLRTSPMAELFFDDLEVPEENRLGREGAGAALFTHSMTWERDRQVPARLDEDRGHEAPSGNSPADALPGRVSAQSRAQRGDGSGNGEAAHQRELGQKLRRRDPDSRRLWLHDRVRDRARAARCARQPAVLGNQ